MFDVERLLGKIVVEVVGKGSGSRGGGNSMLGGLSTGPGLMSGFYSEEAAHQQVGVRATV